MLFSITMNPYLKYLKKYLKTTVHMWNMLQLSNTELKISFLTLKMISVNWFNIKARGNNYHLNTEIHNPSGLNQDLSG